ncbi:MAG: alpha-mannosidase [Clostridia bacterium]|nr:alpha-mannosidase [Clostridia bacterium]
MNNDARFGILKQRIGGERRKAGFEYTFGMKPEEQFRITPADKYARRIMSELEFALQLDRYDENSGIYSRLISNALDVVEEAIERDGSVTKDACFRAEEALMPMSSDAKDYALILCGHAHIDMNWMWSYNETVAAAIATFTTMCNLMDEYPEFTFSQSQASTYKIIEEHEPELMKRIKKYIDEGRWEVTAGAWVETDKNMPAGESLVRTITYTKKYMEEVWGVPAESLEIDFSPDTFGHSAHVPEIDCFAGLKYYYHCRGLAEDYILYRYKAPSGAEMLMYREPYWYNSGITPHIGIGLPGLISKMGGLRTGLIVYGVGDHGGGVTRRDIENAIDMQSWPVFPRIRFGTFREFFKLADTPAIREKLPVVEHEINFLFDGCYTTQSRIKRANKQAEAKLLEAEEMSAIAERIDDGFTYGGDRFEKAWQNVLFTHFHDILTGSCVRDSRDYAMALYQRALATAETEESRALRAISENIDTSLFAEISEDAGADNTLSEPDDLPYGSMSEGAGAGFGLAAWRGIPNPERGAGKQRIYNVFNPASTRFTGPVEITVWDWPGDVSRAVFTDCDGNEPPMTLNSGTQHYWDHKFITFLVDLDIPAFGYRTIALSERELEAYDHHAYCPDWGRLGFENEFVLENDNIRAEFDMETFSLKSLIDKSDGSEKLRPDAHSGLVLIDTQDNPMSAWIIGRHLKKTPVTEIKRIDRIGNSLRQGYSFSMRALGSNINGEVTLDRSASDLCFHYSVDWNERSGETIPLLAFVLSLKDEPEAFICDVPMGTAIRKPENHDIPALTFAAPIKNALRKGAGERTVVLRSDCKYGYRCFGKDLVLSLINTAHNPDPVPERGQQDIYICAGVSEADPVTLVSGSEKMMHKPKAIPTGAHFGTLDPDGQFISVNAPGCAVSSIFMNESEELVLRLNRLTDGFEFAYASAGDETAETEAGPYSITELLL